MFVAPVLYVIHALLAVLSFPLWILLGIRDGTSFSHRLIDFVVLSGNSNRISLFPLVGIAYRSSVLQSVPPAYRKAEFKHAVARYRGR